MDNASAPAQARWRTHFRFALPAIAFAAMVYFPITRSYFYLDDFMNLYHIVNDGVLQYLVRENGGHILLSRNTLFYLTFQIAGPTPELFFWSALVTHLLNVWLLFLLITRLTGRPGLASFGAAFWGISPLNEGTLGWYSVYGHAVVGTALLIVLVQASGCVVAQQPPSRRMRCFWYLLALVAATSFGTGIGIAMALPFVLWLLLYPIERRPPLLSLVAVVPAVYFLLTRLYEHTSSAAAPARSIVSGVFSSLPAVWSLFTRLTSFGIAEWATGFVFPTPAPLPGWTLALLVATLTLLFAVALSPATVRRRLAAGTLIVVAAYGTISMGRGALMAIAPDELIQRLTRYHYTAAIGLTMLLCLILAQLGRRIGAVVGCAMLVAWYAIAIVSYARSDFVIERHQLERDQTREVLDAIRAAIEAQPPGATVRIQNAPFPPFPLSAYVPGWAAAFTMFYADNIVDGRRVEFVEPAQHILVGHRHGRRIGRVLSSPP